MRSIINSVFMLIALCGCDRQRPKSDFALFATHKFHTDKNGGYAGIFNIKIEGESAGYITLARSKNAGIISVSSSGLSNGLVSSFVNNSMVAIYMEHEDEIRGEPAIFLWDDSKMSYEFVRDNQAISSLMRQIGVE
jgi:hypothetical protein